MEWGELEARNAIHTEGDALKKRLQHGMTSPIHSSTPKAMPRDQQKKNAQSSKVR